MIPTSRYLVTSRFWGCWRAPTESIVSPFCLFVWLLPHQSNTTTRESLSDSFKKSFNDLRVKFYKLLLLVFESRRCVRCVCVIIERCCGKLKGSIVDVTLPREYCWVAFHPASCDHMRLVLDSSSFYAFVVKDESAGNWIKWFEWKVSSGISHRPLGFSDDNWWWFELSELEIRRDKNFLQLIFESYCDRLSSRLLISNRFLANQKQSNWSL